MRPSVWQCGPLYPCVEWAQWPRSAESWLGAEGGEDLQGAAPSLPHHNSKHCARGHRASTPRPRQSACNPKWRGVGCGGAGVGTCGRAGAPGGGTLAGGRGRRRMVQQQQQRIQRPVHTDIGSGTEVSLTVSHWHYTTHQVDRQAHMRSREASAAEDGSSIKRGGGIKISWPQHNW